MSARFLIETSFSMPSRSVHVFVGSIVEGEIHSGMKILAPHTSAHLLIDAVEHVDPGGRIGLCVKYNDQSAPDLIGSLNINAQIVTITA